MNDRFDLAIWLESDELSHTDQHDDSGDSRASDTSGIQVHLNFWKLPKYNAFDIGINFPTFKHGKVNIFVNTKSNFEATDLTHLLKTDSIINTIFNEFISTVSCPQRTSCLKTERSSGQPAETFCLCCLTNPISTQNAYGGKIVTFNITNNGCNKSCGCTRSYIRIRLTGEGIDNLYVKDVIPASKFQYYTSRIDFLDFRLNNVRSLPGELIEYKNTYPQLQSVRCFLMIESSEELLLHNKSYKKVRAIEKEKWSPYLEALKPYIQDEDAKKNTAILAYQWNTDKVEQDFSLFTKIKRSEFKKRALFLFFILGMIPSLLATYADRFLIWCKDLIFG